MYERFTDRARKTLALANQEAQRMNHEYLDPAHILLGLIKEGAGVGANVLKHLGVNLTSARAEIEKRLAKGTAAEVWGKVPHTPRAKAVIEHAMEEARTLGHHYVGTEHLLLGLIRQEGDVAAESLIALGVTADAIRAEVIALLTAPPAPSTATPIGWQCPRCSRIWNPMVAECCPCNTKDTPHA